MFSCGRKLNHEYEIAARSPECQDRRGLSSLTIAVLGTDPRNRDLDCCPRSVGGNAAVDEKEKIFQHCVHREDLGLDTL
jgi:hypothetical protein